MTYGCSGYATISYGSSAPSSKLSLIFSETLNLSISIVQRVITTLSETITLIISITSIQHINKILLESINLSISILSKITLIFTESISMLSSYFTKITTILLESLNVDGILQSVNKIVILLLEYLSLVPKIRILINGIIPDIWRKSKKLATTWIKKSKT